jgi:hypothetical protein
MRVDTYGLLRECIERGIPCGLNRCDKYGTDPKSEAGVERIVEEVMTAICVYFSWDDEASV